MRKKLILAMSLILFCATARAQTLQFILDSNDSVGYLKLTMNNSKCTGEIGLMWDSAGRRINEVSELSACRYYRGGASNDYVQFNVPDRSLQYSGWISENQATAAGYYERNGQNHPWFAVGPDFLETVLAERMPDSGFLVLANAAAGFLSLDRVTGDNCEGRFGLTFDPDGGPVFEPMTLTNCKYLQGSDSNDYLEFSPGVQDIRYYAWVSANQDTVAGYYNVQGQDYPWLAVSPEFLEYIAGRFVSLGRTPGAQDRGPRPGHGSHDTRAPDPDGKPADMSAADLARKYGVDPAALAALIKQNHGITVLPEYKDGPEILAVKLKHLAHVNEYRRKNGVGAMAFDIAVSRLCNYHAQDQARNNYMDHNSLDGSTPWDRAERFGLKIWAENIAMPGNTGSCTDFTPALMLSRMNDSTDMFMAEGPGGGHHDNMLNIQHTGAGFGLACHDGRIVYVEEFR